MKRSFSIGNPILAVVILLGIISLIAVACGSDEDEAPAPAAPAPAAPAPAPAPAPVAAPAPAAPAPATAAEVLGTGKITMLIADMGTERFDYLKAFAVGGNSYGRILNGYLIATNENAELIPGMAEDWSVSSDGLTWTITLRDGVKFHDGTEVTVEDIEWSWNHYWSPGVVDHTTNSVAHRTAENWGGVKVTGSNKISLTTLKPDASFPGYHIGHTGPPWFGILPKREGDSWDEAAMAAFDKNPIGTGPFKLKKHEVVTAMELERFDDYYFQPKNGLYEDRRPKFDILRLEPVPEEATRIAAIRAGEADIAAASLDAKSSIEAGGGRLVFVQQSAYPRVVWQSCWQDTTLPCNDKRVRQALALAIDKDAMRDSLFGAEVLVVAGFGLATPATMGYSPDLDPFPYDPDKARALLAEAGYPGGEGFPEINISTFKSSVLPFLTESAQVATDGWKRELGIDTKIHVKDEGAHYDQFYDVDGPGPAVGWLRWEDNEGRWDGSGMTNGVFGPSEKDTRTHNDQEIFDLVDAAMAVFDPKERDDVFASLYKRLRDEAYEFSFGYVNAPWAVSSRVATWEPYPLTFFPGAALHTVTLK